MIRGIVRAVITGVCLTACAGGSDVTATKTVSELSSGEVVASRVDGGVRVTNGTATAIVYVVWDRGFLGLLANPCPGCPKLKAGESVTVRDGIDGFGGYGDAVVYWWSKEDDPSTLRSLIVTGGKPYPVQPPVPDTTSSP